MDDLAATVLVILYINVRVYVSAYVCCAYVSMISNAHGMNGMEVPGPGTNRKSYRTITHNKYTNTKHTCCSKIVFSVLFFGFFFLN